MRIALKIAYDGTRFHGYARQPDVRTVEGELLRALRGGNLIEEPRAARFEGASRTDSGVSAIGNVIAFDTSTRADAVVGTMNNRAKDVWAWAYAEVGPGFRARQAMERWYRYHVGAPVSLNRLRKAMHLFVGDHDLRSFTTDPSGRPTVVHRIDCFLDGGVPVVDIWALSFRRGMVRKILAAAVSFARAEIGLTEIQTALGGANRDFGMVPPEPLFLMDVAYPVPFRNAFGGKIQDELDALACESSRRLRFCQSVLTMSNSDAGSSIKHGRRGGPGTS
jgi:tRNA pseudouridine38-40 synthase